MGFALLLVAQGCTASADLVETHAAPATADEDSIFLEGDDYQLAHLFMKYAIEKMVNRAGPNGQVLPHPPGYDHAVVPECEVTMAQLLASARQALVQETQPILLFSLPHAYAAEAGGFEINPFFRFSHDPLTHVRTAIGINKITRLQYFLFPAWVEGFLIGELRRSQILRCYPPGHVFAKEGQVLEFFRYSAQARYYSRVHHSESNSASVSFRKRFFYEMNEMIDSINLEAEHLQNISSIRFPLAEVTTGMKQHAEDLHLNGSSSPPFPTWLELQQIEYIYRSMREALSTNKFPSELRSLSRCGGSSWIAPRATLQQMWGWKTLTTFVSMTKGVHDLIVHKLMQSSEPPSTQAAAEDILFADPNNQANEWKKTYMQYKTMRDKLLEKPDFLWWILPRYDIPALSNSFQELTRIQTWYDIGFEEFKEWLSKGGYGSFVDKLILQEDASEFLAPQK